MDFQRLTAIPNKVLAEVAYDLALAHIPAGEVISKIYQNIMNLSQWKESFVACGSWLPLGGLSPLF